MFEITADTRFVTETLVTDTVTYEIVKRTAKTMTVRTTASGAILDTESNGSGFPINYTEAVSDPDGRTYTVRLRNDGTFRISESSRPLRPALMIDGKPVERTDYSF